MGQNTDERFSLKGLTIAPGVVEAIVSSAVAQVEGVATIGAQRLSGGIRSAFNRRLPTQGVLITADEEGGITVAVRTHIFYGYRIPEVAEQIRKAVAETLKGQVGITVEAVDIFVDGIQFPE
ncbi:MAG: Asp23/Gls24 family envelope stress response protein [Coriobacteriales bacterium]|jgi:uncharacterized alkaline shock family protein YloU|nr:Asp23/Gls24 family envelope stress response protein [Coriobacteriales bacterium]